MTAGRRTREFLETHTPTTRSVSPLWAPLSIAEAELADEEPFGSHEYLSRRLATIYLRFLEFIAARSTAARDFLRVARDLDREAQQVVFRDALTRRTLEDGVCWVAQGIDAIEPAALDGLLTAASTRAATAGRTLLNDSAECVHFRHAAHPGYVWADSSFEALPVMRFRGEVQKRLLGFRIEAPTRQQISILAAGAALAEQIAPRLAESALNHAFIVVIGSRRDGETFKSATVPGLPGVIVLSPGAVTGVFATAQVLVHEALHLKFLDIDYVHPLFAPGFRQESSRRITPVWHADRAGYGNWPIDRVLTSMHVYLALAVFVRKAGLASLEADLPSSGDLASEAARCLERATWLFNAVQDHLDALSTAGRAFVTASGSVLGKLETCSKVAGAPTE